MIIVYCRRSTPNKEVLLRWTRCCDYPLASSQRFLAQSEQSDCFYGAQTREGKLMLFVPRIDKKDTTLTEVWHLMRIGARPNVVGLQDLQMS